MRDVSGLTTITLANIPFAQYEIYCYMFDDGGRIGTTKSTARSFALCGVVWESLIAWAQATSSRPTRAQAVVGRP